MSPNVTTSGSTETLACTVASSNNNAVIDITYTVTISDPTARGKSLAQARCLKVGSPRSSNGFYGTAYDDKDITLGVADVHKIIAVYEGVDGTPITPNGVITTSSGTFVNYEELIGQTSGARAILINNGGGNASYWYYTSKDGATFVGGETVVGQTSIAVGVLGATISQGSPDIKDRYFFDNGQRDGFYDLSKLTLKPGATNT